MNSNTTPKAQPVEGEELQQILDEAGVKSLDEPTTGDLVFEGKTWRDVHEKLQRYGRAQLAKKR